LWFLKCFLKLLRGHYTAQKWMYSVDKKQWFKILYIYDPKTKCKLIGR